MAQGSIRMGLTYYGAPDRVAQSVGHLTRKSWVLGSIPGLATYFRFSFRFFKKGSCQLCWSRERIGQTYPSAWRKSLSKRGDQASPAQLGKTARLKGSL